MHSTASRSKMLMRREADMVVKKRKSDAGAWWAWRRIRDQPLRARRGVIAAQQRRHHFLHLHLLLRVFQTCCRLCKDFVEVGKGGADTAWSVEDTCSWSRPFLLSLSFGPRHARAAPSSSALLRPSIASSKVPCPSLLVSHAHEACSGKMRPARRRVIPTYNEVAPSPRVDVQATSPPRHRTAGMR